MGCEAAAKMAIRKAKEHKKGKNNLTWGDFISAFTLNEKLNSNKKKNM